MVAALAPDAPELKALKEPLTAKAIYRIDLKNNLSSNTQLAELLGDALESQQLKQDGEKAKELFLALYPVGDVIELRMSPSIAQLQKLELGFEASTPSKTSSDAFSEEAPWAGFFTLASLEIFEGLSVKDNSAIAEYSMQIQRDARELTSTSRVDIPRKLLIELRQELGKSEL